MSAISSGVSSSIESTSLTEVIKVTSSGLLCKYSLIALWKGFSSPTFKSLLLSIFIPAFSRVPSKSYPALSINSLRVEPVRESSSFLASSGETIVCITTPSGRAFGLNVIADVVVPFGK